MIDISPEGRKALRELAGNCATRFYSSAEDELVKLSEAVPLLLDALDRAEDEIEKQKVLREGHQESYDSHVKRLASLQSENAALRERVAVLEKVREAAIDAAIIVANCSFDLEKHRSNVYEALRAALAEAKGE